MSAPLDDRSRGRPALYRAAVAAIVGLTLWTYLCVARQTGPVITPLVKDYTERLAAGHVTLSLQPHPELLALPNPYDPAANTPFRVMDASLYQGRYYLYFGLTPFVTLLVPWFVATGQHFTNTAAVGIFCAGGFIVYAVLLLQARRHFFPATARIATLLGIALTGWAGGQLSLLRLPDIHDVEISCAYFCFSLVLLGCFRAMAAPAGGARWVAGAAAALGLAVGARPSLVVAVPLLTALVCWSWRHRAPVGPRVFVALLVPLALIGGLLAVFNQVRFGNPLEFGVTYQLTTLDRVHHPTFLLERVPYALHRYLFGGFRVGPYFPFIEGDLPGPIARPASHDQPGQFYGFLLTAPALLLVVFSWFCLRSPATRGLRSLAAFAVAVSLAQLALMLPAGMGAHRYATDLLPPVLFASGLTMQALASQRWGLAVAASAVLYSCVLGFLQSAALFGIFQNSQPNAYARVARWFNAPVFLAERLLGHHPTYPRLRVQFPAGSHGPNEPLLVSGDRARENFIFVNYAGPGLIRIGVEVMGRGGPVSGFLPVDFTQPHDIDLELGLFLPPPGHPLYANAAAAAVAQRRRRALIRLDGQTVLDAPVDFHPPHKMFQWGRSENNAAFGREFSGRMLLRSSIPLR